MFYYKEQEETSRSKGYYFCKVTYNILWSCLNLAIFLSLFFIYAAVFLDVAQEDFPFLNLAYEALIDGLFLQPWKTAINKKNTRLAWIAKQIGNVGGDLEARNQVKAGKLLGIVDMRNKIFQIGPLIHTHSSTTSGKETFA